jgi:hypothetical protein
VSSWTSELLDEMFVELLALTDDLMGDRLDPEVVNISLSWICCFNCVSSNSFSAILRRIRSTLHVNCV